MVPKQTAFTPYRRGMIRWVGYIRSEGMTLWPRSHHFPRWATWQLFRASFFLKHIPASVPTA